MAQILIIIGLIVSISIISLLMGFLFACMLTNGNILEDDNDYGITMTFILAWIICVIISVVAINILIKI